MPRVLILANPRSGSTYFCNLLNSHPEFHICEELLDTDRTICDPISYVQNELSAHPETYVGVKVHLIQIAERGLRLDNLVRELGITTIIVIWRECLLENLASLFIALRTGEWYSSSEVPKLQRVELPPEAITYHAQNMADMWKLMAEHWPSEVNHIVIRYEDLLTDRNTQITNVLSHLGYAAPNYLFNSSSRRQNPWKPEDKIINWKEIPEELKKLTVNVPAILKENLPIHNHTLSEVSEEALPYIPDREPLFPAGGWRYRVAEPYVPQKAKQNVFDAIEAGSLSSAGYWPRQMATKLKKLFHVPVAQPCCNGFTALVLAMQAVKIGPGDEVIVPSFTMVADANAAHFLGAKPVFADSTETDYNPDWEQILKVSSEATKMVIVTHTYGVPCPDVEKIAEECKKRNWWFLEDVSECVGVKVQTRDGRLKLLGTFGHFASASLYVNKMIHAGDGGFVIAQDARYCTRLTSLVNHGFTRAYHFVHFEPAINCKINGLGAALASGCLDHMDHIMDHRALLAKTYRKNLAGLNLKLMPKCGMNDTPWVFGVLCETKQQRTDLRRFLATYGIETRDYFFPLHLQPAFTEFTENRTIFQFAQVYGSTGFYFPSHTNLMPEDIDWICSVVEAFFNGGEVSSPKPVRNKCCIQIPPDGFQVRTRHFNTDGEDVKNKEDETCSHIYLETTRLGLLAEECLVRHERWDQRQEFLYRAKNCIKEADAHNLPAIEKFLAPYMKYFISQLDFEPPITRPWLHEDLASEHFKSANYIPGTTDEETLQLLHWLIKTETIESVWEIGCWLGQATYLMAAALASKKNGKKKIFACDAFRWQEWMNRYLNEDETLCPNDCFKHKFLKNVEKYQDIVSAVEWHYETSVLPEGLNGSDPDLVFLDITQETEDFEWVWKIIQPSLIPNKTIIVFNGVCSTSVEFFTAHAAELEGLLKPFTLAKVYRYLGPKAKEIKNIGQSEDSVTVPFMRKMNFQCDPTWDHHHENLYCAAMAALREEFHDSEANVLFIPAVEEMMCDEPELFLNPKRPWVGIIHSVEKYPELYYIPDLKRLCGPEFSSFMKNCCGLFTLTTFQARYLSKNLPKELKTMIPIQPVLHPMPVTTRIPHEESNVPKLWKENASINLLFIGSFARDFDLFYNAKIPSNLRKVLVMGENETKMEGARAPSEICLMDRLSSTDYEEALKSSIVFLSLKSEGAANTVILECIARNYPIVAPNLSSCTDYLGEDYPLLYAKDTKNFLDLITLENVKSAISYLENKDKSKFQIDHFVNSVKNGAIIATLPSVQPTNFDAQYDVTISVCSYKRTENLNKLLEALWQTDYEGTFQIIVWNNNENRHDTVRRVCAPYIALSNKEKSLELISSSANYYCAIRFAIPPLMKSDRLLICDDDIIPGSNFVRFFMDAHRRHPRDVLCVRGHKFYDHELDVQNSTNVWENYHNLRFYDDDKPERFIHFVHADACLVPKKALQECASVAMPDSTFALVDDYWMSYVLNHKFGRKLRKLSIADLSEVPLSRTEDSETPGLALHTRPEVREARNRFYVYHMMQGWPVWSKEMDNSTVDFDHLKMAKREFWSKKFIGFNIFSGIDECGVKALSEAGVTCVRIGAVGIGKKQNFDLCHLLVDAEEECNRLGKLIGRLANEGIRAVLTLDRRMVSAELWKTMAKYFVGNSNIVGYDLWNEPFTSEEKEIHWSEIESEKTSGVSEVVAKYRELISAIRKVDPATPIILEPTFWAHIDALQKFPIGEFLEKDSNLMVSFHFYEPQLLTHRDQNLKRFAFPCEIPIYNGIQYSEMFTCNEEQIHERFVKAKEWAKNSNVEVFVGEFGICRDISGASKYLESIMSSCKKLDMSGFVFSFRDHDWDAMNYELGTDEKRIIVSNDWHHNPLMETILFGIQDMKE